MPDATVTLRSWRFPVGVTLLTSPALILAAALLVAAELSGQEVAHTEWVTLEGEVVDASNNLPLEGAIVSLPGLGLTAVTDSLGYYRLDQVPTATHAVRVFRLGYDEFEAAVPINGVEVLALYLTPGPISLAGIEVEVVGLSELDWRPVGTSRQSFIGPGEIEDLRDTYHSLDYILRVRKLPQARYFPPVQPGGKPRDPTSNGCVKRVTKLAAGRCAMVVLDGVPIDEKSAGWMYQTSSYDIYSVRFRSGPDAFLRWGERGAFGVLEIDTHSGR